MKLYKYAYGGGKRSTYHSYSSEARKDYYIARSDARNYQDLVDKLSFKGEDVDTYFYTDETIRPFGIAFGSDKKKSLKVLGKATFELTFDKSELYTILYFKRRVDSYKYLLQLHFVDNELVYAMNHVYETVPLHKNHMLEMTRLLLYKYTHKNHDELDSSQITLVDSKDNRIIISDSLEYNIRYSSGNRFTLARLQGLIERENIHSVRSKLRSKIAMLNFL